MLEKSSRPASSNVLYVRCVGHGSPSVIYLHGCIFDITHGGGQNAGRIPDLLAGKHRVCVYDRANVGASDSVPGPLTANDSIHDLHRLLEAASIPGPYLLLGASWGGLLAAMYAATYPREVKGMVLLDPSLPTENEMEVRFVPEKDHLTADSWRQTIERADRIVSDEQARKQPSSGGASATSHAGTHRGLF